MKTKLTKLRSSDDQQSILSTLASRIAQHLDGFASDAQINAMGYRDGYWETRPYSEPAVKIEAPLILVNYISYLDDWYQLDLATAARFLRALDAGFVGRHFQIDGFLQRLEAR